MASVTGTRDTIDTAGSILTVTAKGETVTIALSGTYNMTVEFQRAVGSGIDVWETVQVFTVEDATVSASYTTRSVNEKLRVYIRIDDGGTVTYTLSDGVKVVDTHKDSDGNNVYSDDQLRRTYVRSVTAPSFEATGSVLLRPALLTPVVTRVGVPTVATTATALTEAQLLGGIHTKTPAAAQNLQFPTGTEITVALNAMLPSDKPFAIGDSFDWTLINLGGAGDIVTLTVDTGVTFVGSVAIDDAGSDINSSGLFRIRMVSANVVVVYRVA